MIDLKVCQVCGWYEHSGYSDACDPKRGAVARTLASRLAGIPSTQLGYGFGHITFEFHEELHVTLEVYDDGTFSFNHSLYCLGRWTMDDIVEFLRAIHATRIGHGPSEVDEE